MVVRVQDVTGTISFVLFDREVVQLIGHSAVDIFETQQQVGDVEAAPNQLAQMLNKRLLFKIDVSNFNIRTGYNVFM